MIAAITNLNDLTIVLGLVAIGILFLLAYGYAHFLIAKWQLFDDPEQDLFLCAAYSLLYFGSLMPLLAAWTFLDHALQTVEGTAHTAIPPYVELAKGSWMFVLVVIVAMCGITIYSRVRYPEPTYTNISERMILLITSSVLLFWVLSFAVTK